MCPNESHSLQIKATSGSNHQKILLAVLVSLTWLGFQADAQAEEIRTPGLSDLNPHDTTTRIKTARKSDVDAIFDGDWFEPAADAWARFNEKNQKYGLSLSFAYTALYQNANRAMSFHNGAAGDLDVLGRWNLNSIDSHWPAAVVFQIENRHKLASHTPSDLKNSIGSILSTSVYFSEQDTAMSKLYLEVGSDERKFTLRLGKQDPAETYNIFTLADPDNGFLGGGVTDSAIAFPDRGWGATARFRPNDLAYFTAGFSDANADVSKLDFESLKKSEFFYAIETGITPGFGIEGAAKGLYSITAWYKDALADSGEPSGHGFALTAEQELPGNHQIVPFLRYSWNNGSAAVKKQAALGLVFEEAFGRNQDAIGVAAAWAEPTNSSFREEVTAEAFYRFHVTPRFALTLDLQFIHKPARTTAYDNALVGGIRGRIAF